MQTTFDCAIRQLTSNASPDAPLVAGQIDSGTTAADHFGGFEAENPDVSVQLWRGVDDPERHYPDTFK